MKTLADLIATQASVSAHVAMLFADQVYTYADLEELSNQAAHALIAEGLQLGEVACQIVGSRPELIINLFGILKSGAIYAPLNPAAAQLADCKPSIVIADEQLAGLADELIGICAPGCRIWPVGAFSAHSRGMPRSPPRRPIDPDGPALLFYTSGTTGRAKGVQLSHRNVLANGRQVLDRTVVGAEDRLLVLMPIFHVNALCNQIAVPFLAAASIALLPRALYWRNFGPVWHATARRTSRRCRPF